MATMVIWEYLQYIPQIVESNNPKMNVFGINYWHLIEREFDHGGFVETSLMLAIEPELVQMQKAKRGYLNKKRLNATYTTFLSNPRHLRSQEMVFWAIPEKPLKKRAKK